ncbi:solute carrier family 2, facilitated glucose transporter member 8 [Salmo salar]|uniref:Solute carrier family 2, facilitated glucose transporter member 8 n=1 Tax=Salmo salar TaxID=8030 RepID=A0A1S3NKY5_SALSA|nr:solute carrier family 2, facilitated glucose transporter member 8 [Salmo salar]|eukprot:XP_014016062.1 PREDICTED: solute carrier family 2, facilitated glucose transporter member 8-like [Salmo salar]
MMEIQNHESRRLLDAEYGEETGVRSEQDEYLDKVKNGKLYLATFAAVLGPLSFGFVLGYSSPAIPELSTITDPRLQLDKEEASWFGSIVTIGAAIGGLLGGWMVDKIGRKLSLMFCSIPYIFGFTIIIAAQNIWMLYLGRVLTGLASGVTSLVVPLYISEMAHERVRGAMGSCVQLMVVTGIMGVYIAGMSLDWRWLAICCSIPPTLMMVFMCFMPETPRFLLSQGKQREAEEALRFLRGPDAPAEWECARIEDASDDQGGSFGMADLKDPGVYKPLGVGIMLMLFQQLTGINAIMFYAETIFEKAHFKNSDVATVVVAATQVVFTAVAALVMDRAGRKLLLIVSGVFMCLSTAAFGVYFKLSSENHGNSSGLCLVESPLAQNPAADLSWLALSSMGFFITGFSLGWGPIPWLVMSEIFPTRVKGFASSVCVLTNWGSAFIITKTFQNLMDLLTSAGTFWLFSGCCALNIVFTIIFVPETKGKTLEQIQARFKGTPEQLSYNRQT